MLIKLNLDKRASWPATDHILIPMLSPGCGGRLVCSLCSRRHPSQLPVDLLEKLEKLLSSRCDHHDSRCEEERERAVPMSLLAKHTIYGPIPKARWLWVGRATSLGVMVV